MPVQIVLSFLAFVGLSGITPGPANLTSLATSLSYGRKTALRQWTGIFTGAMVDAMAAVVLVHFIGEALNGVVKWFALVGAAYLVYLAFHFLRSSYSSEQKSIKEPGFLTGFFLQLTNAKIIITCIAALSSYVLPNTQSLAVLFVFGLLLGTIQPSCNFIWVMAGAALQRFFVKYTKIVNTVMALLLVLCAVSLAAMPFKG